MDLAYRLKLALLLDAAQFFYLVKLTPLGFLLGTTLLLHSMLLPRIGAARASLAAFTYTAFPGFATTLFGPLIGQFDPIPVFFSLLALALFWRGRRDLSALSLGTGIAFKYYPLVFLPAFLCGMREGRARYAALALAPLAAVSLPPMLADWEAYAAMQTIYRDWAGSISPYSLVYAALRLHPHLWFGRCGECLGSLAGAVSFLSLFSAATTVAANAVCYAVACSRKTEPHEAALLALLAIFSFFKYVQHHYVAWAMPLVVLDLALSWRKARLCAMAWAGATFIMAATYFFEGDGRSLGMLVVRGLAVPLASLAYLAGLLLRQWRKR